MKFFLVKAPSISFLNRTILSVVQPIVYKIFLMIFLHLPTNRYLNQQSV